MYHFLRCRWVRLSRISVTLIMLVMMTVSPSLSPLVAATVTSVDVGWDHACALHSGQVWCWGRNAYGQLGNRTTTDNNGAVRAKKNNNNELANATTMATGGFHTCAVTNGQVWCWGYNRWGQLGDRSVVNRNGAVRAAKNNGNELTGVTAITAGSNHTCAITSGQVWCWGANGYGQLGNRSTTDRQAAVRAVKNDGSALTNVTAIAAGSYHTCALTNGRVWCWGSNASGQLGNNTLVGALGATQVKVAGGAALTGATQVGAGGSTSCAVVSGGARCWGNNQYGQVGDRTTANKIVATPVLQVNGNAFANVTRVDVGTFHTCAVSQRKSYCWGENGYGSLGNRLQMNFSGATLSQKNDGTALDAVTSVAAGAYTTCAVNATQAWCWGNNVYGQVGDRSRTMRTGAVRVRYYNDVAFP